MRKALREVVIVLGFLIALGIADKALCPDAHASYGVNDAILTVGVSTGIGTVLGLSTIAFYDSPTAHLKNALVGAGAGLIVGLGVAAYLLANAPGGDEIDPEEVLPRAKKLKDSIKKSGSNSGASYEHPQIILGSASQLLASVPVTFAMRGQSQPWALAVEVLELRF